tara:strand:+ start:461 stop:1297 length:837 start_codon:yes stop_codon:yes gene_type:complete
MKSELNYKSIRERNFKKITNCFKNEKINEFVVAHKINEKLYKKLKDDSKLYLKISKNYNLANMTPNGKLVPKKEVQWIYNEIFKTFRDIIYSLKIERHIKNWVFPAIRYKEEKLNKLNTKRSSRSELPHSDAWAGWGEDAILIQIPLLGDTINNRVNYYSLPNNFDKSWMKKSEFDKAKKFVRQCQKIRHHYKKGYIYIADISVVHSTYRGKNSKPRMSIDIPILTSKESKIDKKFYQDIISNNMVKNLGTIYEVKCNNKMDSISSNPTTIKKINKAL